MDKDEQPAGPSQRASQSDLQVDSLNGPPQVFGDISNKCQMWILQAAAAWNITKFACSSPNPVCLQSQHSDMLPGCVWFLVVSGLQADC